MDISETTPMGTPSLASLPLVMLVEDNPHDVQLLQEAFRERGIYLRFLVADCAQKAFGVLRLFPASGLPCLIILDLSLPIVSGHTLLRDFARNPTWTPIPKIVLTSSERESDRVVSLASGAAAHIVKPATFDQYLGLVDQLLAYLPSTAKTEPPTAMHMDR
ncbi:MAG: response regulator [Planctomycetes bacterium]|nr:response regulator [Planctomycetota bacterium]